MGDKKPNFDAFFETFAKQCCELGSAGFEWNHGKNTIVSKVFFPIMVCDSVARCLRQGIHQLNGSFGCTWCLNEGKSIEYGQSSRKLIYEVEECCLRTHDQFVSHLGELCEKLKTNKNASHCGITSASQLLLIPKFNIVSGFTYDNMHRAFLGISKSILNWWLTSEYHERLFYVGQMMKEIDKVLLTFAVPSCFDRVVRSIELNKFWKTSEWRTWTFIAVIGHCYGKYFT